jgi:hypothetical protein
MLAGCAARHYGWPFDGGDDMQEELVNTVSGMRWGVHCYQEQERNRSRDCSGTYPNRCQLPPTDPSCAGDSLFPQLSGWCG